MTAKADWTNTGKLRVDWAKERIGDLDREIAAFAKVNPDPFFDDTDSQTGAHVLRARFASAVPSSWGILAGEAVHHLRSSLDILWRRLMRARTSDHYCAFRVYGTEGDFPKRPAPASSPNAAAITVYQSLKPYRGGNDRLWLLDELDNEDKHRGLLVARAAAAAQFWDPGVRFIAGDGRITGITLGVPRIYTQVLVCPVEDGTILWPLPQWAHVKVQPQITLGIAFSAPQIVWGQPLLGILQMLVNEVESVAEAFRLADLIL